ncbi:MAG: AMP-binding protein [Bacteroidota bacterium]|nr:AMP-binding protein [Bacteroidota bacterium]
MSFIIHYNKHSYTANEFTQLPLNHEYAINASDFIKQWIYDLPFAFLSSGSTGEPKSFQFKKEQLQSGAQLTIDALGLRNKNQHILLCLNPKFVGGAMMLARAFELDCEITLLEPNIKIIELLEPDHSYTFASFVPAQLLSPGFDTNKFNRFKHVLIGGAHVSRALEMQLEHVAPQCYHTYGMTETLSHVALRRIGTENAFKLLPQTELKINEAGCICIKTVFNSAWVNTHDMAELLNDGSFKILGRTDFVINSGAYKIHPEQIEKVIEELNENEKFIHGDFIISSMKDIVWGEKCVCVVSQKTDEKQFQKLQELLSQKLMKYQIPREMVHLNTWKFTENGKTNRKAIKELIDNQSI